MTIANDNSQTSVYDEIRTERDYQQKRWGNAADDTVNTPNDWVSYIGHYATKWFPGGFTPYDVDTVDNFRESMVKVATLAVAAIESVDRQRNDGGAVFYEQDIGG